MTDFIVNRPLQPGDRLQSREEMLENALRGPVSDETFAAAEASMLGRPYMAEEEVERAHDRAASEGPPRPKPEDIEHFDTCRLKAGPPGVRRYVAIEESEQDEYTILSCSDCGASTSTLPPLEDPYWDDVREEIER